jgi:hypothetical protein
MNRSAADPRLRHRPRLARLVLLALAVVVLQSCGGIYAGIGIAGPTVDLGPVTLSTGISLGRMVF